jgi:hypothetical protein
MSVLFESVLLFSLAVLILLVGCLVYYFKKRIVDIEQKTAKCLEITQDVYMQQIQFKNEVYSILFPPQQQHEHQYIDERIRVELSEDEKSELESESESESESDSDSDSESDEKVKVVSVDLSFPEECDIHINDESESEEEEIHDEPEPEIVQLNDSEPIVVSKIEESAPPKKPISKDELQKMSLATLKSLLIAKGVSAESVNKMKKKDLVDALSA